MFGDGKECCLTQHARGPASASRIGIGSGVCFRLASERDFSSPNLDSFRARWWCLRTVVLISQRCSCRFVSLRWRAVRGRAAIHWGGIVRQGSTERIPHPGLVTLIWSIGSVFKHRYSGVAQLPRGQARELARKATEEEGVFSLPTCRPSRAGKSSEAFSPRCRSELRPHPPTPFLLLHGACHFIPPHFHSSPSFHFASHARSLLSLARFAYYH